MCFYVILLRYISKLTGFSPKGRLKMRHFFLSFCKLKTTSHFLVSVHHNNYNIGINYQFLIYCPEKGCFSKCVNGLFKKNWHAKTDNGFIEVECLTF